MITTVYVELILLCVLNIIFFLSGVILNSLVIITILKSRQLRKKVCHFVVGLTSCCDFITVLVGVQNFFLRFTFWFTENDYLLAFIEIYGRFLSLSLLIMSIERYLGVYYPIYHRTSVTRRRLLTLLAIFTILPATLPSLSLNQVISYPMAVGILLTIYVAPFIFFNYKLFKISRKFRRENTILPEKRIKILYLKNISSCLLAVACLVFFSIPTFVYIVVSAVDGSTSKNARLAYMWVAIVFFMNCTFNSLIFFWKNKVLRVEGMKILQRFKCRVSATEGNNIAG